MIVIQKALFDELAEIKDELIPPKNNYRHFLA